MILYTPVMDCGVIDSTQNAILAAQSSAACLVYLDVTAGSKLTGHVEAQPRHVQLVDNVELAVVLCPRRLPAGASALGRAHCCCAQVVLVLLL